MLHTDPGPPTLQATAEPVHASLASTEPVPVPVPVDPGLDRKIRRALG
jgi:hypothetical protein